jgi:AraC-like DNA-binding protein
MKVPDMKAQYEPAVLAHHKALCDMLFGADGGTSYEALTGRPLGGFVLCVVNLSGGLALAEALKAVAALPQCRSAAVFAASPSCVAALAEADGDERANDFDGVQPSLLAFFGRTAAISVRIARGRGTEELRRAYSGESAAAQAAAPPPRAVQPVLAKAMDYISSHFNEPLTLDDVAEHAFVSSCYVSRLFMRELGVGFVNYLTSVRMDNAKRLLSETQLKVFEVAELSGIPDAHYFAKLFRKSTGISPSGYRGNSSV